MSTPLPSEHASLAPTAGLAARLRLSRPRPRALLIGAICVVALAFLVPYFNLSLNKYDWAFRPLATGPMFLLMLLVFPINTLLRRSRPDWALSGSELLLIYAMMAISAALANEGLFGYVTVNSVHAQYYGSPGNRWAQLFVPYLPPWLQVTQPNAVQWFFEGAPEGAAIPWAPWATPILSWSVFALALYVGMFSLTTLLRRDWIEGQRLSFPFAAIPTEIAEGDSPTIRSAIFRNPYLWIGFALPVFQSLVQLAHAFYPSIPYSALYFEAGRAFGGSAPWSAIANTYVYIGFETIGILALLPAEVSLSLWFFFLLNRAALVLFSALGLGQESMSSRVFSPQAFLTYQEVGACFALTGLLLWQSRTALLNGVRHLFGRPVPMDPLSPLSPRAATIGLALSWLVMCTWARHAGMDLRAFSLLMLVYLAFTLSMARLVAASGIYVPEPGMAAKDMLVRLGGATAFSAPSLTIMTYLQATFMLEYKVSFMHFAFNDLKVTHSARLPGKLVTTALLLSVLLMMVVVPWVILQAAYTNGAFKFDSWQFHDMGMGEFDSLAASLYSPESRDVYMPFGLATGGALMLLLSWLNTTFLWWPISPIGFVMSGTWAMNTRIWTNALIAWLLVVTLRRFGGLRLYKTCRPLFLGMVLGHFFIMGFRSIVDPMLGLHTQLSPWA